MPGVPRSTCYWIIGHPRTERADPIAGDVRAVRRDSRECYGARKIKAALERRGVTASRRRIVNIMKRRGMTSAYARRTFKPHKTRVNEAGLANILDREFDGYEPRTHLASDLTYVRVGGKWQGGKFDWISTSRLSRDFKNVRDGYGGWRKDAIEAAEAFAFVICSKDGKRRSNVALFSK